jgi:hypothetical protein
VPSVVLGDYNLRWKGSRTTMAAQAGAGLEKLNCEYRSLKFLFLKNVVTRLNNIHTSG